ncbi:hypothetical protein M405DRAFT_883559, partial [Rhizopogon salebrosus TDB-379]
MEVSFPLSLPTADSLLTITHSQEAIWIIELHNGQDSRLTKRLIDEALRPASDIVECSWNATRDRQAGGAGDGKGAGALIIVGRRDQDKFFSNGFDYEAIKGNMSFFNDTANPLFARLLTYP